MNSRILIVLLAVGLALTSIFRIYPNGVNDASHLVSIMAMVQNGNTKAIKKALDSGVDPNAVGPMQNSLLSEAVECGQLEIAKLLIQAGANPKAEGNELLVYVAVRKRNFAMVKLLIESGAYVNVPKECRDRKSPLCAAVDREDKVTLLYLLQNGADPEAQDFAGATAIQAAAMVGNVEMLEILLNYKANINQKDDYGKTALMFACIHGKTAAIEYLISRGANPYDTDGGGVNPAQWAKAFGQSQEVVASCGGSGGDPKRSIQAEAVPGEAVPGL